MGCVCVCVCAAPPPPAKENDKNDKTQRARTIESDKVGLVFRGKKTFFFFFFLFVSFAFALLAFALLLLSRLFGSSAMLSCLYFAGSSQLVSQFCSVALLFINERPVKK